MIGEGHGPVAHPLDPPLGRILAFRLLSMSCSSHDVVKFVTSATVDRAGLSRILLLCLRQGEEGSIKCAESTSDRCSREKLRKVKFDIADLLNNIRHLLPPPYVAQPNNVIAVRV